MIDLWAENSMMGEEFNEEILSPFDELMVVPFILKLKELISKI